jgi:hypothetical protein
VWQEGRSPEVVVEFLSPGTEAGDLGRFFEGADTTEAPASVIPLQASNGSAQEVAPPEKLTVYERYLRVPYYVVYNRYAGTLRFFQLVGDCYQEQPIRREGNLKIWLPGLAVGLGIWEGEFEGVTRPWLRWCAPDGNWLLLDTERERRAKEQAQAQLVQAARNLLARGMSTDEMVTLLGLTHEQLQQVMEQID